MMEALIGRIFIPSESANVVIWKDLYKNISSTRNTQQQKAHSSLLAKFQPNRMWNNQGSLRLVISNFKYSYLPDGKSKKMLCHRHF